MEQGDNQGGNGVFSKRLRAGRRRTYFFDVRTTKSNDYYLTITESKRRYNEDGYERHKLFLYKEDFNKFMDALKETVDHVKHDLLPEYDFDEFSHKDDNYLDGNHKPATPASDDAIEAELANDTPVTEEEYEVVSETTAEPVAEEEEVNEEDLKWD